MQVAKLIANGALIAGVVTILGIQAYLAVGIIVFVAIGFLTAQGSAYRGELATISDLAWVVAFSGLVALVWGATPLIAALGWIDGADDRAAPVREPLLPPDSSGRRGR